MKTSELKKYITGMPIPLCVLDESGHVTAASAAMAEVFLYGGIEGSSIFALTGISMEDVEELLQSGEPRIIESNNKRFRVDLAPMAGKEKLITMSFTDVTGMEEIEERYEKERQYTVLVELDNYDELISVTEDSRRQALISDIDKVVRDWAAEMEASVTKYSSAHYIVFTDFEKIKAQEQAEFPVLAKVREVPVEADFPATLSIGVGGGGANPAENEKFSKQALDMAKGRGGDQVVVKHFDLLYYYGGTTRSVEKRNKGKSRIIGYALRGLMDTASNVIIMGHKNPDMDAFGAALGIYCMARQRGKRAYLVVNNTTAALETLFKRVKEQDDHEIVNSEKALQVMDEKSVVIMVDTHRPSISECPELFEKAYRTVIIDHHRKSEEATKTPTLSYMETYASSTSELVTEILQYTVERKDILQVEADALLAGIMLDTNSFSVKSGIRTFEAAAWLRRLGADQESVKKCFQISKDIFTLKTECYQSVKIDNYGIAYAVYNGPSENAQIINSQVADELLTICGVKASFVASRDLEGQTYISARSLGEINVQVIMEYFGGGGHLNTAGAQMDIPPKQAILKIKKEMRERFEKAKAKEEMEK